MVMIPTFININKENPLVSIEVFFTELRHDQEYPKASQNRHFRHYQIYFQMMRLFCWTSFVFVEEPPLALCEYCISMTNSCRLYTDLISGCFTIPLLTVKWWSSTRTTDCFVTINMFKLYWYMYKTTTPHTCLPNRAYETCIPYPVAIRISI